MFRKLLVTLAAGAMLIMPASAGFIGFPGNLGSWGMVNSFFNCFAGFTGSWGLLGFGLGWLHGW